MTKGIIYYNDHHIDLPVIPVVQKYIAKSGLPIVSCSLNQPTDFGENYVIEGKRGWGTMARQIIVALEHLTTDNVFFTEHDVLYHKSHWAFDPPREDTFYYNAHNWRWLWGSDYAIAYDRMISLSGLCCNRLLALNHFKARLAKAEEKGFEIDSSKEPIWARKWGYEPGTKLPKRGGFDDSPYDVWYSEYPNIDIRHDHTLSVPKTKLEEFRHQPKGWIEIPIEEIPRWNLRGMFNLGV